MQILSSQSSPPISRLPSPPPLNSKEVERNTEETQLSNQRIEGFIVETAQSSDQHNIDSAIKMGRDPQVDQAFPWLAQTENSILKYLDSITANLNRVYGGLDQLEPKILYLVLPVCMLSLSFSIYAMSTLQRKPNHQSTQILGNLLGQINQREQAYSNIPNRLDLIEAELNQMSRSLHQSGSKDLYPAFSIHAFFLFLSVCVISALWKKLNNQSEYIQALQKKLIECETKLREMVQDSQDEKSRMINTFDNKLSNQSEYAEALQNKLTELETNLRELIISSVSNLNQGLNSQSEQIQTLRSEFNLLDNRFHLKNQMFNWKNIDGKPTTLSGYSLDIEVLHASIDDSFFLTDINWVRGIARNHAGFFIPHNEKLVREYKPGRFVKFSNGEMRKIIRTEPSGSVYLNIFLEGNPLDPEKVGLPSSYSIVKFGEPPTLEVGNLSSSCAT
ncbi:hypothetical protein KMZ15_06445 [Mycoavidus sp. HKI]|uniref:hypothetical protein n=1 Tax=Mycoavidus sp. HKI TaxID=2840467 RepID=UPI001CBAB6C2|nr:hypothetical protein [Mycoavidus sp. HKI]UAW63712.1 hypothetical protein KMZ15_06445 [Mycoavidus sp. HKI]